MSSLSLGQVPCGYCVVAAQGQHVKRPTYSGPDSFMFVSIRLLRFLRVSSRSDNNRIGLDLCVFSARVPAVVATTSANHAVSKVQVMSPFGRKLRVKHV